MNTPNGYAEIVKQFGDIRKYILSNGTLSSQFEMKYMGNAVLPYPLKLAWMPEKTIKRMYCHRDMIPVFQKVFNDIYQAGLAPKAELFGGCFNFRLKRTTNKLSTHSWGIAIDLNPATNALGTKGNMNPSIVKIFKNNGFIWGGDWADLNCDPMHFQFCDGY
ncbi:MAG TPA: M15 family metallopeptidase [bacterium]|nr:M15 family metallopeptidase [bacterium]HNH31601.1 M15 family metallopeptidase [bacterium]